MKSSSRDQPCADAGPYPRSPVTGVWLRTAKAESGAGAHVIVEIDFADGSTREVIREFADISETSISHWANLRCFSEPAWPLVSPVKNALDGVATAAEHASRLCRGRADYEAEATFWQFAEALRGISLGVSPIFQSREAAADGALERQDGQLRDEHQ